MTEISVESNRGFVRRALQEVKITRKVIPYWAITQDTQMLHVERALSGGLCSHCSFLRVEHNEEGDVLLECAKGNNPVQIYQSTPYGQGAKCGDFEIAKREIRKS